MMVFLAVTIMIIVTSFIAIAFTGVGGGDDVLFFGGSAAAGLLMVLTVSIVLSNNESILARLGYVTYSTDGQTIAKEEYIPLVHMIGFTPDSIEVANEAE